MTLLRLENASLGYPKTPVLTGVDCRVEPGDFVGIVGPNGSGKTTFLRTVLGEIPLPSGRMEVDRSRRFAYVPQMDAMNLHWPLSVREAVALSLRAGRLFGRLAAHEEAAVDEALARAGIKDIAGRLLREVSGGQRQRAVLAQALCQKPGVLLLDEPTQGLDVGAEKSLMDLLASLHEEGGLTVLFVTHALPLALSYTQKILLFNQGALIETSSDELLRTDRLSEIYGIPFVHHEEGGMRWAAPARKAP